MDDTDTLEPEAGEEASDSTPEESQEPDQSSNSSQETQTNQSPQSSGSGQKDQTRQKPGGMSRLGKQFTKGAGGPGGGGGPGKDIAKKGLGKLGIGKKDSGESRGQELKNRGKEAGKKMGKKAGKKVGNFAAQLGKKGVAAAVENPYVAGALAIILLIVVLIFIIIQGNAAAGDEANPLTITKSGPAEAKVNDKLTYQIAVAYAGTVQDITVTDHVPDGAEFDPSTPPPAHYDPATRTVTWSIKEISPPNAGGGNPSANQVNIIGDSLTDQSRADIQDQLPGAVIDAKTSRPWSAGVSIVSDLKNSNKLTPVVVFALGTNNSSLSTGDIDNLLNASQGSQIILVTTYNLVHTDWANNVNSTLKAAASAHADRIKIADWAAVANPGLIDNSDGLGVHPTIPSGNQAFAKVIASAVSGGASGGISHPNTTLTLNLKATTDNTYVINQAVATAIGGVPDSSGGGGGGGGGPVDGNYVPPNQNDCGGKYKFNNPVGNFGDPNCNFDKNALHEMLTQQDPANADFWFLKVIPCESSYDPNSYSSHQSIGTPDLAGAWGLYQMGSSKPPGSPPPSPGNNGPNDRGDVNWPVQTSNAVTYSKKISSIGAYWACGR